MLGDQEINFQKEKEICDWENTVANGPVIICLTRLVEKRFLKKKITDERPKSEIALKVEESYTLRHFLVLVYTNRHFMNVRHSINCTTFLNTIVPLN